jgi:competence protein ComEA
MGLGPSLSWVPGRPRRWGVAVALLGSFSQLVVSRHCRAGGKEVDGIVNLNTAPAELLGLLPGIGPSKARGILQYRTRHPFRTIDELVRVKGIGRRMIREMRAHLAVAGPSTARGAPGTRAIEIPPPPPLTPPPGRLACHPAGIPLRVPPGRPQRVPRDRVFHSPANHCHPPA